MIPNRLLTGIVHGVCSIFDTLKFDHSKRIHLTSEFGITDKCGPHHRQQEGLDLIESGLEKTKAHFAYQTILRGFHRSCIKITLIIPTRQLGS